MGNRELTDAERVNLFRPLIASVRVHLAELAGGDTQLLWALRRKLAKELIYDERGKPTTRAALKRKKRFEQHNKCAICSVELPVKGAVLDRDAAMGGYTRENTRLLCPACDAEEQQRRGYR